jgi:integrase
MATVSPRRRQYGTGSVFQRSDGMWVGQIEAGVDAHGRRRRLTVYGATAARVKEKLEALKRDIARTGVPETAIARSTTVTAWSATYLKIAEAELRPKSYAGAASAIRKWINPTIGHKRLVALSPADVRAVADAQRKAGRAGATQMRTHDVLIGMLKAAMLEGHAIPQRVLLVKRPRPGENDREAIRTDEALAVLKVTAERDDASMWAAMFLQGLRQGERLGLTWPCVDFEHDTLDVSWQLQPLPYRTPRDPSSGFRVPDGYVARHLVDAFHLVRPKSKASRRTIPMTPWLRGALLAWRDVAPASPHGLVWPTKTGRPRRAEHDRAEWLAIQETAGIAHPAGRPYVLHEARHATATLLLELGTPKAVVELILGHSEFVEAYDHADRLDEARQALQSVAGRLALELPAEIETES